MTTAQYYFALLYTDVQAFLSDGDLMKATGLVLMVVAFWLVIILALLHHDWRTMLVSAHYYFDTVYAALSGPGMTTVIGIAFYVAAWFLVLFLAGRHDWMSSPVNMKLKSWVAFRITGMWVQAHPGVIYAETMEEAARVARKYFVATTEAEKSMIFVRQVGPG